MELSEYRQDFAAYNSAIELAHFEYRAGLKADLRTEPIFDRYGELFTADAISGLVSAYENTPEYLETERSSLLSLVKSARIGYLEFAVRDLINERARCEAAARISWGGETIPAHSAPRLIANEPDGGRRRELLSRYIDALSSCDDLRAACFESFHASAEQLGFGSYRSLFEEICGSDFQKLASAADEFLLQTEAAYTVALSRALPANGIGVALDDLSHADFLYFQRMPRLDRAFPAHALLETYSDAMRGFGINVAQQRNIHVDLELRAGKNPRAACFRVNAPDDVRLSLAPVGGSSDYAVLFHEAGHAQHFAWSSKELVTRHPEFLFAPENATSEGYAFLFNHLFHDPTWIREYRRDTDEIEAKAISRSLALISLYSVRRYCAKLKYELSLHDGGQVRSEHNAQNYAELQTQATRFERSPAMYLMDVDDGFYAAAYLRAWAFEAGLRDHLRIKYGNRWWANRKAGDDLIDLWNTSSRYSVEDLAKMIGFDISFDLLAETLIAAVKED
jgi:hypothetical protein